jgi:hypothetical protein
MGTRKRKSNGQTVTRTLDCSVGLAVVLALALATADASAGEVRIFKIPGISATGLNDMCGEPIAELPPPLPPDTHFTFVGEFDPREGATDAIPLSRDNCRDDILLATTTSKVFLSSFGLPDVDPRLKNLRLRDVPTASDFAGVRRSLPAMGDVPPSASQLVSSEPNYQITLGDWFKARGSMEIQCFPDGTAHVEARFRNLIPNRLYSLAAIWLAPLPGTDNPIPAPLTGGGVPDAIVTSETGSARFQRDINYCPMDPAPDGSELLFFDLGFRSDHHSYGVFAFAPLTVGKFEFSDGTTIESVLSPGTVVHVQMAFAIRVKVKPRH